MLESINLSYPENRLTERNKGHSARKRFHLKIWVQLQLLLATVKTSKTKNIHKTNKTLLFFIILVLLTINPSIYKL